MITIAIKIDEFDWILHQEVSLKYRMQSYTLSTKIFKDALFIEPKLIR